MEFTFSLVILKFVSCEAALRIIGGRDALENEFPYAIRLEVKIIKNDNKSIAYVKTCSGAAVSSKWILTAAHCYRKELEYVARYNRYFPNNIGEISPILKVYIHPQYNEERFGLRQNDVALFLSQNVLVSQFGKISAVDYKGLVGHKVNIIGFGITNSSTFEQPLQVLDGMLNNCLEMEKKILLYTAKMMCVVPFCGVKAKACPGDSGGPVIHSSGIIGVNSLTIGHCHESQNIIYHPGASAVLISMISHELEWISNVISNKDIH
ncbi:serine protease 1-like [Vanessa cardui]|uniref:serine protease 1-like n=1 Tax=Vanessa cardui TaxID=171605 RepID=UPI001F13D792|nr:serine protease 1-like [Vanessa cardui]